MGTFLDKFESWFLNYSRRTLSLLVLVLLLIGTSYLLLGLSNTFDSVNNKITDSFSMPEFEEPVVAKEDLKATKTAQSKNDKEESSSHPMPEYESEISEIVEDLIPLYIVFKGFDNGGVGATQLTNFVSDQLKSYMNVLSDEQMDSMVDGFVNYIDDFSDFYVDKFSINSRDLDNMVAQKNQDIEDILDNPVVAYTDKVDENRASLYDSVEAETREVTENNISGMGQLMVAGSVIGAIVLLILFLLAFKAEHSLRRSADSSEKR